MISNKVPLDNRTIDGVRSWIEDLIAADMASYKVEQVEYCQLIKAAKAWGGEVLDADSPLEPYRLQAMDRQQPVIDSCYDPADYEDEDGLIAMGKSYVSKLSLKHFRNERFVPDRISRAAYDQVSQMLDIARETGVLDPALRSVITSATPTAAIESPKPHPANSTEKGEE